MIPSANGTGPAHDITLPPPTEDAQVPTAEEAVAPATPPHKKKKKKKPKPARAAPGVLPEDVDAASHVAPAPTAPQPGTQPAAGEPTAGEPTAGEPTAGEPTGEDDPGLGGHAPLPLRASRLRRLVPASRAVTVVLLLLLVAGGVGLGLAQHRIDRLEADRSLRTSALTAARKDVVDLTTYGYTDLAAQQARIASESTAAFEQRFAGSMRQLSGVFDQVHATATGSVLDAGIQSMSHDAAVLTVFVDQQASSSQHKATTQASRILVTLVRSHGRWLLDSIQLV